MSTDGIKVAKEEIHELRSNQEETDTRVVLYAKYGSKNGYKSIRIRSPDSDIFFILLHFASELEVNILFDTGKGNSRRLIGLSDLGKELGQTMSTALMTLHTFTGCDSTSSFKGIGKVKPIKILKKQLKFQETFVLIGDSGDIKADIVKSFGAVHLSLERIPKVLKFR